VGDSLEDSSTFAKLVGFETWSDRDDLAGYLTVYIPKILLTITSEIRK
jgi:hypothetical protein